MDYLHINFMINETYMDLACARPFTAYRDTLRRYAVNEDCMQENAPGVLTFFTTREEDRNPVTVLSRTDRHTTTVSVGRFTQCLGWEWKNSRLLEEMDTILDSGFYTEAELTPLAAAGTSVQLPQDKKRTTQVPVTLGPQAKRAILTAAMLRWLRSDPVVRIAVPKDVDYDGYVIAAMKQIYALCPMGLRVVAGFCSYLPDPEKAIDQVYFGFIPQDMADTKTLFLDDSSQSALVAYAEGTRRDGLDRLVEFICSRDEKELQVFLQELFEDVEAKGDPDKVFALGTRNYQSIGDALRITGIQGSPEEHLKEWQDFYDHITRYTPSMQARIKKHIADTVDTEAICRMYQAEITNETDTFMVFKALRTYNALCGDSPALAEILWNTAISHLQAAGVAAEELYASTQDHRDTLDNFFTPARIDGLYLGIIREKLNVLLSEEHRAATEIPVLADELRELEKELLEKKSIGYEALLQEIHRNLDGLQVQQSDMAYSNLMESFKNLRACPTEKLYQIEDAMSQCQDLLQRLSSQPQNERILRLTEAVTEYRAQLDEKKNSSSTDLREILRVISGSNRYFNALNNVSQDRMKKLDDAQRKEVMAALDAKRPASLYTYIQEFEATGQKLNIPVLANKNPFILTRIMKDLEQFDHMTIPYNGKWKDKEWEQRLKRAKLWARELFGHESDKEVVCVAFNGTDYEYTFFMKLLNKKLSHKDITDENAALLESAIDSMLEAKIFRTEKDLTYLLDLYRKAKLSYRNLFIWIIQNRFKTGPKYRAKAFTQIIKASSDRLGQTEDTSTRAMLQLLDGADDLDAKLETHFRVFSTKFIIDDDPLAEGESSRGRRGKKDKKNKK